MAATAIAIATATATPKAQASRIDVKRNNTLKNTSIIYVSVSDYTYVYIFETAVKAAVGAQHVYVEHINADRLFYSLGDRNRCEQPDGLKITKGNQNVLAV